ncbi:MAG: hypothetical protein JXB39_05795 [Deltaproteobacteria bacterium]|nr:hypothetical protein [Deltaproteobacteria bacterium]
MRVACFGRPHVQGLLLLAVTAAAYAGTVGAGFVWDDLPLVVLDEATAGLAHPGRLFLQDLWAQADGGAASGYHRPLVLLSFALDRAVFGLAPGPFHLHSLAWHLFAVGVLHRLLLRWVAPLPALAGAALFALHPVQSEAVTWIAARNDPMAAALLIGALVLLLPRAAGPGRLLAGGLVGLGAMLAKETALLLPLALLALDLATSGRPVGGRRHAVAWAAVGLAVGLRLAAGVHRAAWPPPEGWALLADRACAVAGTAGALLAWPWPLSVGRNLEALEPSGPVLVLGIATLALGSLAVLLPRPRRRLAAAGLALALLAFLPSVLALADKALFGERYLYLPMAGLALAVAAALPDRGRVSVACLALAVPWVGIVSLRVPDWHDDVALWSAARRDTPGAFVDTSLGHVLRRAGRDREALDRFAAALSGRPPWTEACDPLLETASVTVSLGEAVALANGAAATCRGARFRGHRAALLAMAGRWDEAVAEARAAPGDPRDRSGLVLAAWGLAHGDCEPWRALSARWSGSEPAAPQVDRILTLGGIPDAATRRAACE